MKLTCCGKPPCLTTGTAVRFAVRTAVATRDTAVDEVLLAAHVLTRCHGRVTLGAPTVEAARKTRNVPLPSPWKLSRACAPPTRLLGCSRLCTLSQRTSSDASFGQVRERLQCHGTRPDIALVKAESSVCLKSSLRRLLPQQDILN